MLLKEVYKYFMILFSYNNFNPTGNKVLQNYLYNLISTSEQGFSHLMQGKPTLFISPFALFLQLTLECAPEVLGKIRVP